MTDQARRLLSLLGVLPDGIAHDDLDTLQPGHGEEAAASLRKMGLAFDEASRLRMLQPIRDHVQAAHAPRPDDLARAVAYYYRARHRRSAGSWAFVGRRRGQQPPARRARQPGGDAHPWPARGRPQGSDRRRGRLLPVHALFRTSAPTSLLEAAASAASRLGDATLQADALFRLGIVVHDRSDLATAQARYQQALTLYQRVPEPHNIGLTHQGLARMAESQAERHQHIQAARTAWTSIGRTDLIEKLEDEFGKD